MIKIDLIEKLKELYTYINVDIDKAITLGYLHDIGKQNGESHGHVMRGSEYLKNKGYDDEYADICLTHSYLNNDIVCTAGGVPNSKDNPFLTNFIKFGFFFTNSLKLSLDI